MIESTIMADKTSQGDFTHRLAALPHLHSSLLHRRRSSEVERQLPSLK